MSHFKNSCINFLLNNLQKNTDPKDTTKTSYHLTWVGFRIAIISKSCQANADYQLLDTFLKVNIEPLCLSI